jgi:hypothetical protein
MLKLQWEGLVFGGCDCPLEGPRSLPANHLSAQGLSRSLGPSDGTTWGCPLRRTSTLTKGGKQAMNKRSTHRALCRFFARCGRNGTGAANRSIWQRFYFYNTLKTKMFFHRLMASGSNFHSSHGASSPVLAQIGKPLCMSLMQAGHRRQAAHFRFSSPDSAGRFAAGTDDIFNFSGTRIGTLWRRSRAAPVQNHSNNPGWSWTGRRENEHGSAAGIPGSIQIR